MKPVENVLSKEEDDGERTMEGLNIHFKHTCKYKNYY
jgi:hypothetical protein